MAAGDRIKFKINGLEYSVGCEVSSDITLLDYIRETAELRGTKYMCREGGCGACIVSVVKSSEEASLSVNSCMVSVMSCQNWEITTIESLGNRRNGYHPIQKTLADYNGSQCGYCSPGWVMSMYSLLQNKKDITMSEIEQSFGSNICRCTGYRPILDAFKTFANDSPNHQNIPDIEDASICNKTGKACRKKCIPENDGWCIVGKDDLDIVTEIQLKDGRQWFRVLKINDVFNILQKKGLDSYMLISGNTAKGVYPIHQYPQILIDISGIAELKSFRIDQNLIVGAGTTLTEFMNVLKDVSNDYCFQYLETLYKHLKLIAHIPVRNIGTLAGNLMIKHQHNEFPSDIFLLLETVGARLNVLSVQGLERKVSMQEFLNIDMKGKLIFEILLPPLNNEYKIVTFKVGLAVTIYLGTSNQIMPRSQNAHAIVNAGFFKYNDIDSKVQTCRLVFGGLSSSFVRATSTESLLVGKKLFSNYTLQSALIILQNELVVKENPPEPSSAYRKQLALALFYKGLLTLCPENILSARYQSGALRLHESVTVSQARQVYDTKPNLWPLNQPVQKLEALIQCSGEVLYTEDLPNIPHEVYAAFVLSTVSTGTIESINYEFALEQPGVIGFYSATDIPGINSFTPNDCPPNVPNLINEEVLCSETVKHYNQPIGIIVAETRQIAERVAKLVKINYNNTKKPVLDIKDAKKYPSRVQLLTAKDATNKGGDVKNIIKGKNTIYGQYHFTMETLVCISYPSEKGLTVYSTSQWPDVVQLMISRALNIDQNRIDVYVQQLGGGFGMKISRNTQVAVACSLVAYKLNRPCRFVQSLTTNTRALGKRMPCSSQFQAEVNEKGIIQSLTLNVYEDNGYAVNEHLADLGTSIYSNCYDASRWDYKCFNVITDTAKNTYLRAPGTLETISIVEGVMEKISYQLSVDPVDVRLANLDNVNYADIKDMFENLKMTSEYLKRRTEINNFNEENRWKKRGLRFSFLRWESVDSRYYDVNIAVYHGDGSVVISHGGIEIGQGINTKAAQICAYTLNIPLEKIQVKGNNTIITPNGAVTGGSITSQSIGIAVQNACEELLERLEPIKKMPNVTWEVLINEAFKSSIDLQSHGYVGKKSIQNYSIYGVTLAEVQIDILTGESEIIRVDLLEDAGQSVSPGIDVGQIEGAFVMGVGYWMTEKLVYDETNGELLTDRTWNYYVPQARDIPRDFRVYLRKNSYSNQVILGSKSTGEPPICMAVAIPFAIREALTSARLESGIPSTNWFEIDGPYTVESICMAAGTKTEHFKFN
ncbi:LOW QUALITY PROTEIN: uncharacterized protein ACR2FA_004382 [Aphomia sociella]